MLVADQLEAELLQLHFVVVLDVIQFLEANNPGIALTNLLDNTWSPESERELFPRGMRVKNLRGEPIR